MSSAIIESEIPTLSIPDAFKVTVTGLKIQGRPTFKVWDDFGVGMLKVHRAMPRIIGDWLRYGEWRYGEKFSQAAALTGYKPAYLRNVASVTARVEMSQRRDSLTFSHDQCVVTFAPEIQGAFFDLTEKYQLPSRDLKKVVSMAKDMSKKWTPYKYTAADLEAAYRAVLDEEEYGGDFEVTYGVRFTASEVCYLLRKMELYPDEEHSISIIAKLVLARGGGVK